jgi:hypothetical protein
MSECLFWDNMENVVFYFEVLTLNLPELAGTFTKILIRFCRSPERDSNRRPAKYKQEYKPPHRFYQLRNPNSNYVINLCKKNT